VEVSVKHKKLWLVVLGIALVGTILFLQPLLFTGKSRPYSSDLNDLRVKFNQDKGKVRLLALLSPT
jgi:nicotinamide riboside transporter PnuC